MKQNYRDIKSNDDGEQLFLHTLPVNDVINL